MGHLPNSNLSFQFIFNLLIHLIHEFTTAIAPSRQFTAFAAVQLLRRIFIRRNRLLSHNPVIPAL